MATLGLTQKGQPKGQLQGNDAAAASSSPVDQNGYVWVLGAAIGFAVLAVINQSKLGHATLYYTLWLMVVFLVITQAPTIANALSPFSPGSEVKIDPIPR